MIPPLSRFQADLVLLLVALIWGTAFIAQKTAFAHVGPFTFITLRFFLAAVMLFPLALRERRTAAVKINSAGSRGLFSLCIAFSGGVILQQVGIGGTSVTNAGFFTGLYVVFVPLLCLFIFREKITPWIIPAAILSLAGVYFLSGAYAGISIGRGDVFVLGCAAAFAFHVVLMGRVMAKAALPMQISFLQYAFVTALCAAAAFYTEEASLENLRGAFWPIVYAGVVSSGIAYTLQAVGQQYAPPSDAAVILSAEAVFAALAAMIWLGEKPTMAVLGGCALIAAAIFTVELVPRFFGRKNQKLSER